MGLMTRLQIVSEGLARAGRDNLKVQANGWLQLWLNHIAGSWPWPALLQEKTAVPVVAGVTSMQVGNGTGGVTNPILRVLDNNWLYTADKRTRKRVRLKNAQTTPEVVWDPTSRKGLPESIRVGRAGYGKWTFSFDPTPDQAYLLVFDYMELPTQLTADGDVPWYDNDLTMVQLVETECQKYSNGPDSSEYQACMQALGSMIAVDRVRYGAVPGMNDQIQLDPATYGTDDT